MKKGEIIKNADGSITIQKPSITLPDIHIVPHVDGGQGDSGTNSPEPAEPVSHPILAEKDSPDTKYTYDKNRQRLRVNQTAANLYLTDAIPNDIKNKIKKELYFQLDESKFFGDSNYYLTRGFVNTFGFNSNHITSRYSINNTEAQIITEVPLTEGGTFYIPKIRRWDNDYSTAAFPFQSTYSTSDGGGLYIRYNSEKKV